MAAEFAVFTLLRAAAARALIRAAERVFYRCDRGIFKVRIQVLVQWYCTSTL